MKTVTVHKAKTTLSQLIAEVEAGEDVVIMRGADPAVRMIPAKASVPKRVFGALTGKVVVTQSCFDPLPEEELAAWDR